MGLSTANQLVVLQGCAPSAQVGLWVGNYNFVGNLAGVLAPIMTGLLIQWTGSYTPAFVLAALMLVAGQLFYWVLVGEAEAASAGNDQAVVQLNDALAKARLAAGLVEVEGPGIIVRIDDSGLPLPPGPRPPTTSSRPATCAT